MQLHPTRSAVDLTFASIGLIGLGVVLGQGAIVAWGGALILGLQIARAVTLLSVTKVRAAGFEMLWTEEARLVRIGRGQRLELKAEVRNRDARAARYVELRALHSPHLQLSLEPKSGEVPAGGRLAVTVTVGCDRVGRHGIYGLSLEVQGSPGLYEVPLTFSNPFAIEVMPSVYSTRVRPARGGRSRSRTDQGRAGRRMGGHYDLREIRDYQSGDPFKRIAWKATGRRGKLMTRVFELEERDVVWLLLDASTELWAGHSGQAPLDHAIDEVASVLEHHLARGDKVGLGIVAARRLAWHPPEAGAAHLARLMATLALNTATFDADRSALDESEVAARVLEHLRPLEPNLAPNVRLSNLDRLARRAAAALRRSPGRADVPFATSPREQTLRHYLKSFGIDSPPRLEPDRDKTDWRLVEALKEVLGAKPKPSLVYTWSKAPDPSQLVLLEGLKTLPRRHSELRWMPIRIDRGLAEAQDERSDIVHYAVTTRAKAAHLAGIQSLRRLGIQVEEPRKIASRQPMNPTHGPPPTERQSELDLGVASVE
ncbi:MAG: hypothetical protein RJA70_416 [Pseudomonadota bacterium]